MTNSANIGERDDAVILLSNAKGNLTAVINILVDGGYTVEPSLNKQHSKCDGGSYKAQ